MCTALLLYPLRKGKFSGPFALICKRVGYQTRKSQKHPGCGRKKEKRKKPHFELKFPKTDCPSCKRLSFDCGYVSCFCCWRTVMDGVLDSMRKTMCSCKRCQCPWYCSIVYRQHDSWEEGARGVEPWSCSMVAIPIWRSLFFLLAKFVKKRTWKLKFQIWSDLWGFQLLEVKKKKGVKIVKSLYSVSVSNQKCWRIIEDLWFTYIWFYSQIWAKSSYEWLPFAHICVWMITHFGCITKFIWKKNTDLEFGRHTGMY